jgi:hypothetical protein
MALPMLRQMAVTVEYQRIRLSYQRLRVVGESDTPRKSSVPIFAPLRERSVHSLQRQVVRFPAHLFYIGATERSRHYTCRSGLFQTYGYWCYSSHKNVGKARHDYHCYKPLLVVYSAQCDCSNEYWSVRHIICFYFCVFVITWSDDFLFVRHIKDYFASFVCIYC